MTVASENESVPFFWDILMQNAFLFIIANVSVNVNNPKKNSGSVINFEKPSVIFIKLDFVLSALAFCPEMQYNEDIGQPDTAAACGLTEIFRTVGGHPACCI